jgi:hypothetical protein
MRHAPCFLLAPLLVTAPALAQEPPSVVFPLPAPVAVPVPPVAVTVPIPVPPVGVAVQVPPAVAPPPAPYPAPPAPGGWAPPLPPPYPAWPQPTFVAPPPPPPKRIRGVLLVAELGAALPVASPEAGSAGFVTDLRFGYRLQNTGGVVWIAPLGDVGWVQFPKWEGAFRAGAGIQLGLDAGLVEPSLYAIGGGYVNIWKQGGGVRAGAALDFRPGRFVSPGVHLEYDAARWDTGSLRYVGVGAHVGFILGR